MLVRRTSFFIVKGNFSDDFRIHRSRPELWPPSHSEIIAGLEGENAVHGATIPGWFRGPFLLPSSGGFVSHASSLPGNSALSKRPIPTRSRSTDGAKREPPAIAAVSRGEGGVRTPAERAGIVGVERGLGDIAVSFLGASTVQDPPCCAL